MTQQIRFRYHGSWTRWFDFDDSQIELIRQFDIECVEIIEEMTPNRFKEQFPSLAEKAYGPSTKPSESAPR